MGIELLYQALAKPLQQIAQNAGFDGTVVAHRVLREKKHSFGFDALKGDYGDMLQFGIVDPTKVTKAALSNAVSVASLLLTTDALIVSKPEPKKKSGPGGGGMDEDEMGGMGGMGGGMDF
jgi:chaperonin GroEL